MHAALIFVVHILFISSDTFHLNARVLSLIVVIVIFITIFFFVRREIFGGTA